MKKLIVLIGLLALAGSAYAGPASLIFVGFSPGGWQTGYPYFGTIDGGPVIDVMCDDWEHGGFPGQTWQANFTNLGTGNLSALRFNQLPQRLILYDEAGWLLLQAQVESQAQRTDINYAVWHIFDSNAPLLGNAPFWLASAQQEASLGFLGVDFYRVGIYTPVNQYDPDPNGPQELLTIVPEPGTLAMFGWGLIGLAGILRHKSNV